MSKPVRTALIALGLAFAAPAALAHTTLESASIQNGATLTKAPSDVTLSFRQDVAIGSVELLDSAGKKVALTYKPPVAKAKTFIVPLPTLKAGAYQLGWTFISRDGHTQSGKVAFTVGAEQQTTPAAPVAPASAHQHGAGMETKSSIADGAVLTTAPKSIKLDFGHPMRLTNVRLSNGAGEVIPVRFHTPATGTRSAEITLPALDPDRYSLSWSADAGDHTMGGTLKFEVR